MSKKKQTTEQSSTSQFQNTYDWRQVPDSPYTKMLSGWQPTTDPGVGYAFGNAKNQLTNSFANPLGGAYTPQMRDSILRSSLSDLAMKESQAKSAAQYDVNNQNYAKLSTLANLTNPRLVQTGGTSSGTGNSTVTQSGGVLESILGGALGAGSSLLAPVPAGGSM